jgi:hypothetical protein
MKPGTNPPVIWQAGRDWVNRGEIYINFFFLYSQYSIEAAATLTTTTATVTTARFNPIFHLNLMEPSTKITRRRWVFHGRSKVERHSTMRRLRHTQPNFKFL